MPKTKVKAEKEKVYLCRHCSKEMVPFQTTPAGCYTLQIPFGGILFCTNDECSYAGYLTMGAHIKERDAKAKS